ncbi:hypothetical protein QOZ80_5AG0398810 [Eleusine coracana subsp. coracana]|nr:hypothetical protein QOZ80_5AG0398810 [Eleusine coracana subsp. coracana]
MVLRAGRGLYSLKDMNVSTLFYPSREEAKASAKDNSSSALAGRIKDINSLPALGIGYEPFNSAGSPVFSLLGKSKILCSDVAGNSSVYNTECDSFFGMPGLKWPKGPKHISVSIRRTETHARSDFQIHPDVDSNLFRKDKQGDHVDSLYILDMDPNNPCSFEPLAYYPVSRWCWKRLPAPPFLGMPLYVAPDNIPFTVVDGTKICVSSDNATYTFDTVAIRWSKVGDWALPFHSKAEYDADLGM